jgi:hypothetical protein
VCARIEPYAIDSRLSGGPSVGESSGFGRPARSSTYSPGVLIEGAVSLPLLQVEKIHYNPKEWKMQAKPPINKSYELM